MTSLGECAKLPGALPPDLMAAVRTALTTGRYNPSLPVCGSVPVGAVHAHAIGYATIEVINRCSPRFPDDPTYIATELLFDNVLIGDYQHVDGSLRAGNFAGGSPMVHIRAIPEGGPAGSDPGTNLPYTFYDRYTIGPFPRTLDRRQPLPSVFAARFIQGGTGSFNTDYSIWREGVTAGIQTCANAEDNSDMPVADVVRFDERSNASGIGNCLIPHYGPCGVMYLPASSSYSTSDSGYPLLLTADIGGWMYLNLNNGGSPSYSARDADLRSPYAPAGSETIRRPSQNWVVVSMWSQGRYSTSFDAATLGNACSPAAPDPAMTIGPAGGVPVCPKNVVCVAKPGQVPYNGSNVTP